MKQRTAYPLADAGHWSRWSPRRCLRTTLKRTVAPALYAAIDAAEDEYCLTVRVLGSDLRGSEQLGELVHEIRSRRWASQLIWGSEEN